MMILTVSFSAFTAPAITQHAFLAAKRKIVGRFLLATFGAYFPSHVMHPKKIGEGWYIFA